MRSLILKLVIFLVPIALCMGYLEFRLARAPNSYSLSKTQFEANSATIEVLVMGSSHSVYGINPRFFEVKGFNLSSVDQDIYYDAKLLADHVPALKKLKLVILPISYFSFEFFLGASIEEWRQILYARTWNIPFHNPLPVFDGKQYSYFALYGRDQVRKWLADDFSVETAIDSNGWWTSNDVADANAVSTISGKARVEFHHSGMHPEFIAENIALLEGALQLLKSRGIQVVFLTTPVAKTYSDNIDPARYQRMQNHLRALSAKYDVPYFNYFYDARFDQIDFSDNDHLNSTGAEKFSKIINTEIILPRLR